MGIDRHAAAAMLPENAVLTDAAWRDAERLDAGGMAAVLAIFVRIARGEAVLPRQVEHLGGALRSVRTTYNGCEYRMVYAQVRRTHEGRDQHVALAAPRLVGLVPWNKKRKRVPSHLLRTAQSRLDQWQRDHLE